MRVTRTTFSALSVPNYRLYAGGQSISMSGTWMQSTAQAWLVLTLTHSAVILGVVVAIQFLPVLVLGAYGGVIADRVDRRRLMTVLQSLMGVQALIFGVLTLSGQIRVWEIFILAALLGLNSTFENPSRQAFVMELVGAKDLRNAVSLNSVLFNVARVIGPAAAGLMIASVGIGWCFIVNALSFVAVVTSLLRMNPAQLHSSQPIPRSRGQLREGLRYVLGVPELLVPLLIMGLVSTLAYEFSVVLPVMASHTFHGGARDYGFMTTAMGVGAVAGGLFTAARGRTGLRPVGIAVGVLGITILLAAAAPSLTLEYLALGVLGWASISFIARTNSTLQLNADPAMRGRVMSLWAVAVMGTAPIGAPLIGWITGSFGPRGGLVVGAASCLVACGLAFVVLSRGNRQPLLAPEGERPKLLELAEGARV